MRLVSKIGTVVGVSALMAMSARAEACDWGQSEYICCGVSSEFNGPATAEYTSCAWGDEDADTECAGYVGGGDYAVYWDTDSCD